MTNPMNRADGMTAEALQQDQTVVVALEPSRTYAQDWKRLGALLALFAVIALLMSKMRPLWFDELFTLLVARQPTLHEFKLAMPADANPPLLPFVVRQLIHLFGASGLAVRLPSVLAFVGCLAGVWAFVRRNAGGAAALLAAAVTMSEPGWLYAYEARPYSLLLGFMMLTLVSWQIAAAQGRRRLLGLAGMVVGIVGAMASHHIGLVEVGLPVLFGEVVRLSQRRRVDWPVAATFLVAVPMLLWTLPMAHRTSTELLAYAPAYHVRLTLHVLANDWVKNALLSLFLIVDTGSVLLIAALVWTGWKQSRRAPAVTAIPRYEVAAAVGALLLIPVTWVLMMLSSGYYNCRYGIGTVAGLGILAGFGCARVLATRQDLVVGLTLAFVGFFLMQAVPEVWQARKTQIHPEVELGNSQLPVAFSDVFSFYQIWWYATPEQRSRMVYLTDTDAARKYGYLIPELAFQLEQTRQPVQLQPYDEFLRQHDHFLAYFAKGMDVDSLSTRLRASGFALDTDHDPKGHRFLAERR